MDMTLPPLSMSKRSLWLEPHPALRIPLIDHLFNRLDGAYPIRWRSAFADPQSIANWREAWAEAFDEEGLTPEDVRNGLKACRKRYDWPPSVSEFIKACRPEVNVDAALYEATQQLRLRAEGRDQWSNPAIYWAAIKVGEFDMLNLSHGALVKRFGAALDAVLAQDQIPDVPARLAALPAPGRAVAAPERVEAAVKEVRALHRVPGDKRWAQRIVDRDQAGSKVPYGVLQMARSALGLGMA
ncbi:replication protein P [Cupriavidus gilardii]|uniref:replication protein P n=1 Tax=Cupriavidus gilardii TaxID=82541 RepID=UPI0021B20875|nr:replication protein P [Cupriavidus gilardii]UXC34800.1 replication protein P [Cupriavidus gilardii]